METLVLFPSKRMCCLVAGSGRARPADTRNPAEAGFVSLNGLQVGFNDFNRVFAGVIAVFALLMFVHVFLTCNSTVFADS